MEQSIEQEERPGNNDKRESFKIAAIIIASFVLLCLMMFAIFRPIQYSYNMSVFANPPVIAVPGTEVKLVNANEYSSDEYLIVTVNNEEIGSIVHAGDEVTFVMPDGVAKVSAHMPHKDKAKTTPKGWSESERP